MLVLYRTGVIRVTDKMRRTVIGATLGVAVLIEAKAFRIGYEALGKE